MRMFLHCRWSALFVLTGVMLSGRETSGAVIEVLVNQFKGLPHPINVFINPPAVGSVQSPGAVPVGTPVTLQATANPGYLFSHWNVGNGPALPQNPLMFTTGGQISVSANFVPGVTAAAQGDGSVIGTPTANIPGQAGTFTAVPGRHADFVGWFLWETLLTTDADVNFVADGSPQHFVARFVAKPAFRTTVGVEPPYAARFSDGGSRLNFLAYRDQTIQLQAYPWAGFVFREWQLRGESVNDEPAIHFDLTGDTDWVARFEPTGPMALVSFAPKAPPQHLVVPEGTNVVIVCDLSHDGYFNHGFRWRRGKRVLAEAQRSIVLQNVKVSDTGVYRMTWSQGPRRVVSSSVVRLKVVRPRPATTPSR